MSNLLNTFFLFNSGFENKENLLKNVDQENHKFKKEKIITKTHDETTFDDIPDLE